jgi:hypothetical protein
MEQSLPINCQSLPIADSAALFALC